MSEKIKSSLFISWLVVLLLPALQQNFAIFNNGSLGGYFKSSPDTIFSFSGWFDNRYQEQKSAYFNDNVGFRPALVRVKNQLDYSLFDTLHGDWLAPGKNHYLFQTIHINGYYGRDFIGKARIATQLRKLKAVQDTLGRLGKTLVAIHAPCKAYFFPEYISDKLKGATRSRTNLDEFLAVGDSLGLHQINFNGWFCALKNKTQEPLFTKQGIHWSVYGSLMAADSFINYLEHTRNIKMSHLCWTAIDHSQNPRESDDDLARTLNLLFPYTTETLSYPNVYFSGDATATKPSVIYIGDSFLLNWINDGLMQHTNSTWQVWEHFNTIWDSTSKEGQPHKKIDGNDWMAAIQNTDCIVLMYTSFNLNEFGDGFIEQAYDYFYPGKR